MVAKKKARKPVSAKRSAKQPANKVAANLFVSLNLPLLGTPCTGQGGSFAGVIRSEDGKQVFAEFVIDPKHWPKTAWGEVGRIAGSDSEYDGMANTQAMAAAGNQLAKKVLGMKVEGHGDIYIAAPREARLAYINGCLPTDLGYAWTSRQSRHWDSLAWAQDCSDGNQLNYRKSNEFPVVLGRRVLFGNSIIR